MTITQIFVVQIAVSLLVFGLAARWYVLPAVNRLPLIEALTLLILPHALRTLGLAFLVPGSGGEFLPAAFAAPGAYGDLLAVVLALLSVLALRQGWRVALGLVWLLSIPGLLDFANAYALGIRYDIVATYPLGPLWFIPTYVVPAFIVLHLLVINLLITRRHEYVAARRLALPARQASSTHRV
jgi:hypothetical protein